MTRVVLTAAILAALFAGCTYSLVPNERTDPGIDASDTGADVPDALDVAPAEVAGDVAADGTPDVPIDAPDVPDLPLWTGLQGSGLPLQRIAGIASQMDTKAPPNADRDFEYAQYAPYPGFRMRNGHRWRTSKSRRVCGPSTAPAARWTARRPAARRC